MIYIVILNWNGWRDTIACVQSLLAIKGVECRVIVCDNASSDGSLKNIQLWSEGILSSSVPEHPRLAELVTIKPPVDSQCFTQQEIEQQIKNNTVQPANCWLTLIANSRNGGFAAGNNVGLCYALAQQDMTHVWLLNNDTLVEPDCLLKMLYRLEQEASPAVCGSRVMFYDAPDIVQALGGNKFNRCTGNASASIGRFSHEKSWRDPAQIEQQIDYISGCSMLLPRAFLADIGLMDERYFLYYEEVDWALRAKGKYQFVYADDGVIYHKEGSAIGSASIHRGQSPLSEFYTCRNKLWLMRRYFPWCFPLSYLTSLLQAVNRFRRGQWLNGWQIMSVLLGKREFG